MTQLRDLHKKLVMNLKLIAQRAKIYDDKKRFEKIDLEMKKKPFLLKKNIKIAKKSDKLIHLK